MDLFLKTEVPVLWQNSTNSDSRCAPRSKRRSWPTSCARLWCLSCVARSPLLQSIGVGKQGETSTEIRSRKNGIQMDPAFRCISDSHFGYEKDVPKKWRNRTPRPQSPLVSDALHPLLTGAWEPLQVGDFQLKTNRGWKSTTGACSTEGRTLLPATWPPAMVKTRCNLSWWRLNVTATGNNTANLTKKVGNIKFGICDLWLENLNVRHGAFYSTYSTNKCWTAWLHLSPL